MVRCSRIDSKIEKDNTMGVIPLVVKVGYRYIDRDYNFVDIIGKIDAKAYSADDGREYLSSGSAVGVDYSSLVKEVGTIDLSDKLEEIRLEDTALTLEVGKSYINGNKAIVTIESVNHGSPLPLFIDKYGHSYSNRGVYNWSSSVRSNLDLVEEVFPSIEDNTMDEGKRSPISLKVGYSYLNANGNTVNIVRYDCSVYHAAIVKYEGGVYYSDRDVPFSVDGLYCEALDSMRNRNIPKQPDLISEIGPMIDPIAVTGQRSTIQFSTPKSYLTATDVQNIANYVDKIEQIVNRVGLGIEIKLEKLEDES